ncbi:hypothetical protein WOLCODRAFT_152764 [Wolfiporia cocos MD-104 SS10]|uniref:Uncharacterized protein n=1 Tax=Wolfiporia cocos (strain MD-104) TaxID=742152 RepID=A0A2H3JKL7_WOLCO|nr:hypothetical protein WOLCODRAFT_152764 [Wolfiporia cocos MD-104 SS10]
MPISGQNAGLEDDIVDLPPDVVATLDMEEQSIHNSHQEDEDMGAPPESPSRNSPRTCLTLRSNSDVHHWVGI